MSLEPPEKVRKLQAALHAKAKGSPGYRFYLLYDKLYREDILDYAYRLCAANGGAAGVDGQGFADIESQGREAWLGELARELREKGYRPQAIRRVYIPKPSGGQRPLGIPTVRDRVVQTAAVLVLSPIFEADLPPEQYGYRPGRSGLDAVREVHTLVNSGHREVVDADLSGYFDSIPHAELMTSIARRISDRHVLRLIKQWLKALVEETDDRGRKRRTTRAKDTGRGVPQGAPLSPLLSNLYMRRFVLGWTKLGHARRLGAQIVNYADDFVICCRGSAEEAMQAMRAMMKRLKLTVNETKTRRCRLPEESFDFLGYTIGRCWSAQTGRAYLGTRPSRQSLQRLYREISERTDRRTLPLDPEQMAARLNRILVGWANYFCLGPVSNAYRSVDHHAAGRLRQWLRRKHKLKDRGTTRHPDSYLYEKLGLVRLSERTRHLPWATA
ncbi:MAG TPA: group II intron reverse transcriptase/maturase [Thermoanaerobaculia bacterium]|nr:group II intron reverse transcriptase/maturase [Thermoanaerobaculia bacterium]